MPDRTEAEAREACTAAGYDPDFVGTKGYPNWQDHGGVDEATRAANAEASLRATRAWIANGLSDFPFDFGPDGVTPDKADALRAAFDEMRERADKGPMVLPEGVLITRTGNTPDEA
jgi:hypothetical protein